MEDLVGKQIDRYLIRERIGEGGMAVVYRALNTRLDAEVAVKLIRTERLAPEIAGSALKRFEREAKSLAQLTHANIVGVMDYGDYEGQPYLVMEFLRGGSLKKFLGKPMPWQQAVRLVIPIAYALEYAHKHNVIHRDVKPSNILLTESGQPMLVDFGIAKIVEEEVTIDLTGTRGTIGTPEYMSPEQGLGKPVDVRTDIYALGVVLYELLTGRKPFLGDTPMETLFKHVNEPLPRPTVFVPNLPVSVENILMKSLAKNVSDRYASMADLALALEDVLQGRAASRSNEPKRRKQKADAGTTLWNRFLVAARALTAKLSKGRPQGPPWRSWYFVLPALIVILLAAAFALKWGASNAAKKPPVGMYYVSDASGNRQIYSYSEDGITLLNLGSEQGENWAPAPDGHGNLYFVSNRDHGETDIYIRTASGETQRITETLGSANSWAPAPDGHGNLYYVSDRDHGEIDIYVLTQKEGTKRITRTLGAASSWVPAPDGNGNLYYVSNRDHGEIDIYVLTQKEGTKRFTTTLGSADSWSPAPDSQGNVYYVSNRDHGAVDIFVHAADGKTERITATSGPASSWSPLPDPSGNLFFTSNQNGKLQVFIRTSEELISPLTDISQKSWIEEMADPRVSQ